MGKIFVKWVRSVLSYLGGNAWQRGGIHGNFGQMFPLKAIRNCDGHKRASPFDLFDSAVNVKGVGGQQSGKAV